VTYRKAPSEGGFLCEKTTWGYSPRQLGLAFILFGNPPIFRRLQK
jgi:hypothetical protein